MSNYKQFFIVFFLAYAIPNYAMHYIEDTTRGFWYGLYRLTGYEFTRNDTVRCLVKKITSSTKDSQKKLNKIKKHLKKGANPNVRTLDGKTLLYVLIERSKNKPEQFEQELKKFRKYGLDVNRQVQFVSNRREFTCHTAISYIICSKHIDSKHKLINTLIENGADVNIGSYFESPLKLAVNTKNIETIKYFLQKGSQIIDINEDYSEYYYGEYCDGTAFHWVVGNQDLLEQNPEIVETIITHSRFFNLIGIEEIKAEINAISKWAPKENKAIRLPIEALNTLLAIKLADGPIQKHVEYLLEVLNKKNLYLKNKTASELLYDSNNQPKYAPEIMEKLKPLLNGTQLREDLDVFNKTDLWKLPSDNLVGKILHNYQNSINLYAMLQTVNSAQPEV